MYGPFPYFYIKFLFIQGTLAVLATDQKRGVCKPDVSVCLAVEGMDFDEDF